MVDKPVTDKKLFSAKELFFIISFIAGAFLQYFTITSTIKIQIHDAISDMNYNKKEQSYKFEALQKTVQMQGNRINLLTEICTGVADKPKKINIETEEN